MRKGFRCLLLNDRTFGKSRQWWYDCESCHHYAGLVVSTKKVYLHISLPAQTLDVMPDKCKTRQELAEDYGVDRKTFAKMLKRMKIELPPGLLTPEGVSKVYEALGRPEKEPPPRH